jgi:hypothetical protein
MGAICPYGFHERKVITREELRNLAKLEKIVQAEPEGSPERPFLLHRLAKLYRLTWPVTIPREQGLAKAIQAYRELATNPRHSNYPHMDEVLADLAELLLKANRGDEARVFFLRLVEDFPNSKRVPEGYLSYGDYYLGKNAPDAANKFYDKVKAAVTGDASIRAMALYKEAQATDLLGDHARARQMVEDLCIQLMEGALPGAWAKEVESACMKTIENWDGPNRWGPKQCATSGDCADNQQCVREATGMRVCLPVVDHEPGPDLESLP